MKVLMTGNEATARGAYEAGVTFASAYPGTPSTEILENLANYKEVYSEWTPNEKVAIEVGVGASIAGARSLSAMKHVGLNVAADPMFTYAYLGVNGGYVIVTADDPGLHSSQNEQDNRYYARHAKMPLIEPSNSQEAKDFLKEAYKISERFDVPVLFRLTTRICHSKSVVELEERKEVEKKPYKRNISKFVATPAACRKHHVELEEKLKKLEDFSSNDTWLNREEINNSEIGIITSGISYEYAKEIFGNEASYLKLGMSFPIPKEKIKNFSSKVKKLYVIEENEPFLETEIKAMGINVIGKEKIPLTGELNPDIIAEKLLGKENKKISINPEMIVPRPPTLCSGCPHRGLFFELSKRKNAVITGDIGCYTLGSADPLNAMDTVICMGAGISAAHGFSKVFEKSGEEKEIFGIVGDSTFFHSGITSLIDIVYNKSKVISIILDNRVTGMTGHQENPGTGYTLMGEKTEEIDIEAIVKAVGIKHVKTVDPNKLDEVRSAINEFTVLEEPSVIITKWPCALKKLREEEKQKYKIKTVRYQVNHEKCKKCKMCLKVGCPSISFDKNVGSIIDINTCVGCSVCAQVCPFDAIEKAGV
ncbi:indolepyruvate ferredoxin oxidoreductase subunit alpha [Oceanotoga sp. DSM 15011]|uniref:indolepyruvate ferredoxin oxidoreductase subunit alpha n=1 Tax=unclassified Oceanotoga TaxID=2618448 RepID=UPI0021F40A9F|nr:MULTISPECIES: indolepyruvate ferredoxin oxidoreductase subunit alpha [unclassified Oceanotoga]MDN5341305.1 indolepyruvate ferredoxin oxidoreductase, alpha subunit [Oceanotoga sp.]UYO99563.1 indolepyruvate ferredoxin oxidoreductase subunit alpha [Oceanotoga sp. DSM 15011]